MTRDEVLLEVDEERTRQETLKEQGKFLFSCADKGLSEAEKLAVLTEELGEIAHEVTELVIEMSKLMKFRMPPETRAEAIENVVKDYRGRARKELIQVAAVAVAWVEALSNE